MRQVMRGSTVVVVFFASSIAMAGTPHDVIEKSNGYPSGAYFNLNIHGKDTDTFICDVAPGGNSVFTSAYGTSTIHYVSQKKSSLTALRVLDPCAGSFDNDPAKVMLPYEKQGYYVFARLRGKMISGLIDEDLTPVLLYPNEIVDACNDTPEDPKFPDYTECLLPLGLITTREVYDVTPEGFVRFDPTETKGKEIDITRLFAWSGWICDASLDTSGPDEVPDGVIDEYDVPGDHDGDTDIDFNDIHLWLEDQELVGLCTYYDSEWILNIADLVVTEQDISNDGGNLLNIRFYPVATTEFIPE